MDQSGDLRGGEHEALRLKERLRLCDRSWLCVRNPRSKPYPRSKRRGIVVIRSRGTVPPSIYLPHVTDQSEPPRPAVHSLGTVERSETFYGEDHDCPRIGAYRAPSPGMTPVINANRGGRFEHCWRVGQQYCTARHRYDYAKDGGAHRTAKIKPCCQTSKSSSRRVIPTEREGCLNALIHTAFFPNSHTPRVAGKSGGKCP